jgi:hypothetical protein
MRMSTRQDWIAATAVLAALVATFAIPAATTGASLARAVAAIAIGALIALAVARAPFTFAVRVRSGFVLLVALALWYVLTRFWAVEPAGSMFESARVSAFVLLAWAVHTSVTGAASRWRDSTSVPRRSGRCCATAPPPCASPASSATGTPPPSSRSCWCRSPSRSRAPGVAG